MASLRHLSKALLGLLWVVGKGWSEGELFSESFIVKLERQGPKARFRNHFRTIILADIDGILAGLNIYDSLIINLPLWLTTNLELKCLGGRDRILSSRSCLNFAVLVVLITL